jgi:hypothetical protein
MRIGHRTLAVAGGAALIALTAACGNGTNQAPSSTTTTTPTTTTTTTSSSAPPAPAPTEKSVNPNGGNLFTPGVKATPAPNVPPGQHPGINGIP